LSNRIYNTSSFVTNYLTIAGLLNSAKLGP
jgi:hypothetical protein